MLNICLLSPVLSYINLSVVSNQYVKLIDETCFAYVCIPYTELLCAVITCTGIGLRLPGYLRRQSVLLLLSC